MVRFSGYTKIQSSIKRRKMKKIYKPILHAAQVYFVRDGRLFSYYCGTSDSIYFCEGLSNDYQIP